MTFVTVLDVFQIYGKSICYQIKGECYINHINAKLKQNDHPLTNYGHFSDPTPQMYIHTKTNYAFFTFF